MAEGAAIILGLLGEVGVDGGEERPESGIAKEEVRHCEVLQKCEQTLWSNPLTKPD